MFSKKAKENSQQPNGWTDEMLNKFTQIGRSFNDGTTQKILLIKQIRKQLKLRKGENIFTDEEIKFVAQIGCEKNDPLLYVVVEISFPFLEGDLWGRAAQVGTDAVGYMMLDEVEEEYPELPKTPKLDVALFGDAQIVRNIEEYFIKNKIFGNAYLPIWVRMKIKPIKEMNAKQAIDFSINDQIEITQWDIQQGLSLQGPIPQDFMF